MIQTNIHPEDENAEVRLQNKIVLLYLVEKFDIPLAGTRISQFAVEEGLMNYYHVQAYLQDMVDVGYLETSNNSGTTHFAITDEGHVALDTFATLITGDVRNKVTKFVGDNVRAVKKDFGSTANLFYDKTTGEYIVKCGVYENDMTLMEINLSVVSRDQAMAICSNWRENVERLYGEILSQLLRP